MLRISKTFYDWCIENNRDDYKYWDNDLNNKKPTEVSYNSKEKFYFKCSQGKHDSFLKGINNLVHSIFLTCPECNSFYQWCIDNNETRYIDAWEYDKNVDDIHFVQKGSGKKYWFKIDNIHSYLYPVGYITSKTKNNNPFDTYYNSFGYYLISNFGENAIDLYWSNKNDISPFEIRNSSDKKIWIKCQEKNYHDDYQMSCSNFKHGNRCPMCASKIIHPKDSFAQFNIDRFGEEWLEKCWCDDNTVDPFKIPIYKNKLKVHLKCLKIDYHDFYTTPATFDTHDSYCPYCGNNGIHHRTHKNDSLGANYPEIFNIWSDKNKKSPYDYAVKSHKKIWLKCENNIHEDYLKIISDYTANKSIECPKCVASRKESKLQLIVSDYLSNELKLNVLHEYYCTCIPINPITGYQLLFDNEVPELKLIIEVHGIQHYEVTGWHITQAKKSGKPPEEEFEYQKWKDEFKMNYALSHGYNYIAIPYWEIENENYKNIILNKINEIKKYI